jgi:RNA polymerase sigma-70 factor (ECF subfamily)
VERPGGSSGNERTRAQVLALVRSRVEIRFSLTADALVDRVVTLAGLAQDQIDRLVLDDLYLATACAAGDENAWREVEQKHFAFMRDFAARFLPRTAAEDLAADVVADLWQRRKIGQFEGRSSLRTWLGAVVTRASLNAMASAQPALQRELPETEALRHSVVADHDSAAEGRRLARFVRTAIDRLDSESKLLLLFHYEQGLSLDQMEPIFAASKATLSRRLKRVREELRAAVERLAAEQGGPAAAAALGRGIGRAHTEFDLAALLGETSGVKVKEEVRGG